MGSEHDVYQRLTAIEETIKNYWKNDRQDIQENRRRIRKLEGQGHHIEHIPTHSERISALEQGQRELKSYLESRFWALTAIASIIIIVIELAFKLTS